MQSFVPRSVKKASERPMPFLLSFQLRAEDCVATVGRFYRQEMHRSLVVISSLREMIRVLRMTAMNKEPTK